MDNLCLSRRQCIAYVFWSFQSTSCPDPIGEEATPQTFVKGEGGGEVAETTRRPSVPLPALSPPDRGSTPEVRVGGVPGGKTRSLLAGLESEVPVLCAP